jgi:hypothetical protein
MSNRKETPFSGTVTARNCPTCGHHEIGMVSESGVFHPLRPGTRVLIMDEMEPAQILTPGIEAPATCGTREEPAQTLEGRYWVPEPIKGDRRWRLKYGVVIQGEMGSGPVTEHIYESAYLQKLSYLLEKEVHVPIAAILDRFFVAPHLASGESRDIVNNMFEELEEISRPVEHVKQWIREPDEKTLRLLIQPDTMENLEKQPVSEETALEEQRALELEEFLELL